jgi:hypothetical protein
MSSTPTTTCEGVFVVEELTGEAEELTTGGGGVLLQAARSTAAHASMGAAVVTNRTPESS